MIRLMPRRNRGWFRCLLLALLAVLAVPGFAQGQNSSPSQPQPSLAEQAAAARRAAATAPLDSQVAGHVVAGEYRNDFFGFALKPMTGWESLNRGAMNVDEAVGRDAANLGAGVDPTASGRVFGMHDAAGSSVFLSIKAVPPGADTSNLEGKFQQTLRSQLSEVRFQREATRLGDDAHRFDAFRFSYTLKDQPITQTMEYLLFKGYLITLTVTAPTPEKLNGVLHDLQSRLRWTGAVGN